MDKRNIFIILTILVLFTVLLPIGSMNLPLFNRQTIILAVWFVVVLALEPKLLLNKTMYWLYASIVVSFVGALAFWDNTSNMSIWQQFLDIIFMHAWIALPVTMNLHFINSNDYKGYRLVINIALIFILITSITSIIGLSIYPEASRNLAAGSESNDYLLHSIYSKMGIATYGFYAMAMFIIPSLGYTLKKINHKYLKVVFFLAMLVVIYSIYMGQHTTILLFAIAGFVISRLNLSNNFKVKTIVILFLLFVFNSVIVDLLNTVSDFLPESDVTFRLKDVAKTLQEGDYNVATSDSYFVTERLGRSNYSLDLFLANPIVGSGTSGGHAFWLDKLGSTGLFGFLPFIMIFISSMKLNIKRFSYAFRPYYYIVVLLTITFGLIKGMGLTEVWLGLFFILPGAYYLTITNSIKKVKKRGFEKHVKISNEHQLELNANQ